MKRAKMIAAKLLYPPKWVLAVIPPPVFAALIFIFVSDTTESAPAYGIYCMSAYSLTIWIAAVPAWIRRLRNTVQSSRPVQKLTHTAFVERYQNDLAFRGSIGIYEGIAVNFFYVVFRIVAGIRYASVWFLSIAVYYLVLGCLRTYLAVCYRHRTPLREYRCYRTTAWLLFLLNIPMSGMIVLMVRTSSGFSYPGYILYLSALYTFYTMTTAVINLVKFRRLGSPILSAAKVLHFVAAMMSILGLQTAMLSRFSVNGNDYRKMMNGITGGFVYGIVILIAIHMLLYSRHLRKKVETGE